MCVIIFNLVIFLRQATLDVVMNLQFHLIEKLWETFWYSTAPSSDGGTTIPNRCQILTISNIRLPKKIKSREIKKIGHFIILMLIHCFNVCGYLFFCSEEDMEDIRGFPREKLISLCKYEPIKDWMRSCDHILYQALVEILIPDVLRPVPS